jgi:hypothetical protein
LLDLAEAFLRRMIDWQVGDGELGIARNRKQDVVEVVVNRPAVSFANTTSGSASIRVRKSARSAASVCSASLRSVMSVDMPHRA